MERLSLASTPVKVRFFLTGFSALASMTAFGSKPPLAKYEPRSGCYLGVSIVNETFKTGRIFHDEHIGTRQKTFALPSDPTSERIVALPDNFVQAVGKQHAIFFSYFKYGVRNGAIGGFLGRTKKYGRSAQVAVEPRSLDEVRDDATLHLLAKTLRDAKMPVFLRFASEMNGNWVSYNGNPTLYREKFRLVARVMHAEAPNVAMVWCVSATPQGPITSYFPGDDVVDWVGVNFYSVYHSGAVAPNPADSLDYVYRTYSAKHPIMICEWGASHQSVTDNVQRPDFAAAQMARLYASLPRKYPRVKAVHWLSLNAIWFGNPGQRSNNYSLLDDKSITRAYARAIRDPYYLTDVVAGGNR